MRLYAFYSSIFYPASFAHFIRMSSTIQITERIAQNCCDWKRWPGREHAMERKDRHRHRKHKFAKQKIRWQQSDRRLAQNTKQEQSDQTVSTQDDTWTTHGRDTCISRMQFWMWNIQFWYISVCDRQPSAKNTTCSFCSGCSDCANNCFIFLSLCLCCIWLPRM